MNTIIDLAQAIAPYVGPSLLALFLLWTVGSALYAWGKYLGYEEGRQEEKTHLNARVYERALKSRAEGERSGFVKGRAFGWWSKN